MKPCKHPDGPEAYHKVVLNVDHATKARIEKALTFYSQGDIDRCTALNTLLDDARRGLAAKVAKQELDAMTQTVLNAFPGAVVK